jgi:ketosteroid isomerase-like protein
VKPSSLLPGAALALLAWSSACGVETRPQPDGPLARAIRPVLQAQVEAWNHGDLDGYMAGYWNAPGLTFYSGGTITRGWQSTLDRYRRRYQGEGREMGRLEFEAVEIEPLGRDTALARGRWRLALSDGKELKGLFTVIMKEFPEGWKIIHDHSSGE